MSTDQEHFLVQKARVTAEAYFRREDYYCSEAIITTINDLLGRPLPREIVKLASGFPVGIGMSGCVCGSIAGGSMALGLVYGRSEPGAQMPDMFPASSALHDHIKEMYGATCCRVLVKPFPSLASPERAEHCIKISGEVAAWVVKRFIADGKVDETGALRGESR